MSHAPALVARAARVPRIALAVKLIYTRDRPRSRAAVLLSEVLRSSLKRA